MTTSTIALRSAQSSKNSSKLKFDVTEIVEKYGNLLYRFALRRVGNEFAAEDLVQETLLAALGNLRTFSGQSSVKTWLTSILKHKIYDYFRKVQCEDLIGPANYDTEGFFQPDGGWKPRFSPSSWTSDPAKVVETAEFWEIINSGLTDLPKKTALAFLLHDIEGTHSEEVCRRLGVSRGNLWVMLHRARTLMRNKIESDFFE